MKGNRFKEYNSIFEISNEEGDDYMTIITIQYINGEKGEFHVKKPIVADKMYYIEKTYIEFNGVYKPPLTSAYVLIPFNNVASIIITEEDSK